MQKCAHVRELLLVDDSENDRILQSEALRAADPELHVRLVHDGDECLEYLRSEALPKPDLVLLDLHLRRVDGPEVLDALRGDPALCHMPVVVMSTSANEHEVAEVYRRGCRSYVVKPASFVEMRCAMAQLLSYWSSVARRP
jgi:two-component system, chemotaxis family, response regulator Rcp1